MSTVAKKLHSLWTKQVEAVQLTDEFDQGKIVNDWYGDKGDDVAKHMRDLREMAGSNIIGIVPRLYASRTSLDDIGVVRGTDDTPGNPEADDLVRRAWKSNNMPAQCLELFFCAPNYGKSYLLMWPTALAAEPDELDLELGMDNDPLFQRQTEYDFEITHLKMDQVVVEWDPIRKRQKRRVGILYVDGDWTHCRWFELTSEGLEVHNERIKSSQLSASTEVNLGTSVWEETQETYTRTDINFMPVYEFATIDKNPIAFRGRIYQMQITELTINALLIMRFATTPMWALLQDPPDAELLKAEAELKELREQELASMTEAQRSQYELEEMRAAEDDVIDIGPNRTLTAYGKAIVQLGGADPKGWINLRNELREELATTLGIPVRYVYRKVSSQFASGVALEVDDELMVSSIEQLKLLWGADDGLTGLIRDMTAMAGYDDVTPDITWSSSRIANEKDQWALARLKNPDIRLSAEQVFKEMGRYSPEKISELVKASDQLVKAIKAGDVTQEQVQQTIAEAERQLA